MFNKISQKKLILISKNFKLIKEFKAQRIITPKVNKIIKLINNSKKEGSKKNLLYFSNKNISNKKTKAVVPTGEI